MIARSLIVISTLGLIFSCAPKDQKVNRPFDPTKAGPAGTVSLAEARADDYRHLAVLVERTSEVIQLFKVLSDSQYAAKNKFLIEDFEIASIAFKKITAQVDIPSELSTLSNSITLLAGVQFDENKAIQKIVITEDIAKLSVVKVIKTKDQSDLVLNNKSKKIVITKSKLDDSYDATFETIDEANVKVGKSLVLNDLQFNFSQLAEADTFKINSVSLNHSRYGVQANDFSMKSSEVDLITKLNEKCTSISGHLALSSIKLDNSNTKPLYTRDFVFNDSSLILKSGKDTYDLKAASCEERPVVDLSKLL